MKIVNLLYILNQLKMFHWQTKSFAQHDAFGNTYETLDGLTDEFVEVFIGKHGRSYSLNKLYDIQLYDYSESRVGEFITKTRDYLINDLLPIEQYPPVYNSDLLNLRDEMLAAINKLAYLLTLER